MAGHRSSVAECRVTSATSNDAWSNPDRTLSGCVRADRNGLLVRLRKLYIWAEMLALYIGIGGEAVSILCILCTCRQLGRNGHGSPGADSCKRTLLWFGRGL